ncbi:hypothetical protein BGZ65_002125 [Modicella reniformis]|uniref:Uncharacterized protein n=1 Tax=Modicella reniformis TaxID=1440133 RepID=A0A9P6MJD9_9FUNG|nr:hypothetical protein BGZ65_002125 [Modicella reniformis]
MPSVPLITGDDYIQYFATTLKTSIETDHSFYPPILIAHGLHALVAQKYVESNPVSALVLVSPFIPELIKDRFQELSHQLLLDMEVPEGSSVSESEVNKASAIVVEEAHGSTIVDLDLEVDLTEFYFETHADILAQEGFKERYILPKKAVYKIDQIAKELQEKGRKEMKEKETHSRRERDKDAANQEKEAVPGDASVTTGTEALGKDSVPVWEVTVGEGEGGGGGAIALEINTSQDTNDDTLPEQTVESEASIPSPLEKLPLNIYDTMAESIFEPHFPILLVTSNGDELVSTDDVKLHHDLAGLVDHIELEDLDDGGHLIMVSDNTEWEQGIQGITAWLDSNGM